MAVGILLSSSGCSLLNLHGHGSLAKQSRFVLPSSLPPHFALKNPHFPKSSISRRAPPLLAFSPAISAPPTSSDALLEAEEEEEAMEEPLPAPLLHPNDVASDGTKKQLRLFYGSWAIQDVLITAQTVSVHVLAAIAVFRYFSWHNVGLAAFLWLMTGLGITLSYHRNLSHRSFKLPKWLEYFWAYWGVQAMQGDPLWWVSTHRYHHQHTDTPNDPHSPNEGFFHSHAGWLFNQKRSYARNPLYDNVPDLASDPFYKFINKTYPLHPTLFAAALYAIGGIPYVLWGWGFRCAWMYHTTFFVNSAAHVWGYQSWKTGDTSRNNWWVAILAFGEGWHNNHHAFPTSAKHGLAWWEYDMTWIVVKGLQMMGLVTDIKLPTQRQKERLALT